MSADPEKERILVVDDSLPTLEVLQRNLAGEGYQVLAASDAGQAIELLESTTVDLVITDLKMPKVSGLDLVRHVRDNLRDTEIMMITGYPSIEGAVQAVKTGAEEYLPKPFTDEELISAVRRALDKLHIRKFGCAPSQQGVSTPHGLMGESEPMRKVFRAIEKAASTSATVLITGTLSAWARILP